MNAIAYRFIKNSLKYNYNTLYLRFHCISMVILHILYIYTLSEIQSHKYPINPSLYKCLGKQEVMMEDIKKSCHECICECVSSAAGVQKLLLITNKYTKSPHKKQHITFLKKMHLYFDMLYRLYSFNNIC